MEHFRIDTADVFIDDRGEGCGKITISDTNWDYNFSYYWGAMGPKTMKEFLVQISPSYFSGKLCGRFDRNRLDFKASMKSVRAAIREEFKFWEYMPWQKELRDHLREQFVETDQEFYYLISNLKNEIWCELTCSDEKYVLPRLEALFEDPHPYIVHRSSAAVEWLEKFHKKLRNKLKKDLKSAK